jgi:hypothetical protein
MDDWAGPVMWEEEEDRCGRTGLIRLQGIQ